MGALVILLLGVVSSSFYILHCPFNFIINQLASQFVSVCAHMCVTVCIGVGVSACICVCTCCANPPSADIYWPLSGNFQTFHSKTLAKNTILPNTRKKAAMFFFKIILNFKDIWNPGKATLTKWCQNNVSISITYQHQASKTNKTKNTITKQNLCLCALTVTTGQ